MRQSILHTLRTYPWRQQLLCLLPSLLLLCGLAAFIGTGNDVTLCFKACETQDPFMTRIVRFFTDWTNFAFYLVYAVLFAVGLFGKNKSLIRFVLVFAAVQILISSLLVQGTKIAVGRPRPVPAFKGFSYMPFSLKGAFHSFPSGHTAEISGAASSLANRYRQPLLSLLLGLIVALVGFSRIYLCMHHISDVAGGLVFGVFVGLLVHHLCRPKNQA